MRRNIGQYTDEMLRDALDLAERLIDIDRAYMLLPEGLVAPLDNWHAEMLDAAESKGLRDRPQAV